MIRTYTMAIMEVSEETFEEIKRKMLEANYNHVFHSHEKGPVIDMNGIAIQAKVDPDPQRTEIEKGDPDRKTLDWYIDMCVRLENENTQLRIYKEAREAKDNEDRSYHGRRDLGFSAGHLDGDL